MRNFEQEGYAFFIDNNGNYIDIGQYTHSEYLYYYINDFLTPSEIEEYRDSNDDILMFAEEHNIIRGVKYMKEIEFDIIEENPVLLTRIENYLLDNLSELKDFKLTLGVGGTYSGFGKTYFMTMQDFMDNDFSINKVMVNYKKFKR